MADEPQLNYYPETESSSSKEGDAFEPAYNSRNVAVSDLNMIPSPNGSMMIRDSMQSVNFAEGIRGAGWQIKSNGDATFQNVTVNNVKEGGVISVTAVPGDDLQQALDDINTQGGGVLYLSPGTYTVTSDLVVYDNTQIEGDSSGNTTISFGSAAYGFTFTGTDVYTTGTLSVNQGSTAVTGSGTTWTAAMIGRQIFISNRWYVIANVGSTTSITLATAFADANVAGASYRIANPINNVSIKYVTITGSTTNAIEGTDIRDLTLIDVVLLANNVGISLTNFMNISIEIVTCAASTSNGSSFTNGSFCNTSAFANVSNGGSGVVTNNIKSCTFVWSAANANTADGYNCTDTDSCAFKLECSGNGGQGIEFVSGCDGNFINDGLISGNTSDGIKLTATCDNNTLGGSLNLNSNGGYGINIAASSCDNNIILSPNFINNSSGTYNDSGTGTIILISQPASLGGSFGGSGADGVLSVTSGTTNIDASSANVVVKNYLSISISSGATLGLTNPASDGTILILKSQGNVTIEGTIDLTGDGAAAETDGFSLLDDSTHVGGTGGNASVGTAGTGGTGGAVYGNKKFYVTDDADKLYRKLINLACGCGGGNGGRGGTNSTGGAGGRGGGSVIIECKGSLDFDAGGVITVNGAVGSVGTDATGGAGGGGGGGSAGMCLVLYNSLTDNSGTVNAKGGAGGNGGTDGGSGGDPGGGGGAGAGSWTRAGANGGAGANSGSGTPASNGSNGTDSDGAGGGGGGHGAGQPTGGTGGTQGSSDTNHYLITQNKYFA